MRRSEAPAVSGVVRVTRTRWWLWAVAGVVMSCAGTLPPVPVGGPAVTRLAGAWRGHYQADASARSGTIDFQLATGADTAFGEVTVLPKRSIGTTTRDEGRPAGFPPVTSIARSLSIRFVRAVSDTVYGILDPYQDPECGCTLVSSFVGVLSGERIAGSYTTVRIETGERTGGEWSVRREVTRPNAQP